MSLKQFIKDTLHSVYVVVAIPCTYKKGNTYYFAAQTDIGIALVSNIKSASIFTKQEDAEDFADEIESKMEEMICLAYPVPRLSCGPMPDMGIR